VNITKFISYLTIRIVCGQYQINMATGNKPNNIRNILCKTQICDIYIKKKFT